MTAPATPWTAEEDALLRAAVGTHRARGAIAWDKVAWATGRTAEAAQARARRLGLVLPGRAWTAEEEAYLLREWADVTMRVLREHLPGRSSKAIRQCAWELGLRAADRRQGLVSITVAAERAGYSIEGLQSLLARQGVAMHRVGAKLKKDGLRLPRHVDWDDVVAAVARDVRLETKRDAARRLGLSEHTVRARLRAAGVSLPHGCPAHLPPETYDQAVQKAA